MTRTSAGLNFAAVADYLTALLLIDLQAGFGDARWGRRNNSEAEVRAARLASDLGFTTTVVSDATATFDRVAEGRRWRAELLHGAALASLADEFAVVIDTDAALAGAACGVGR